MKREHTIDTVFALALFCIFTASVLFVLISGALSYKTIANNMQSSFEERTCVSYISAKIRSYDSSDKGIEVKSIDGFDVLILLDEYEGTSYSTYIYCYNGFIRELYCESSMEFDAESGFDVMVAKDLSFEKKGDSLIYISCTAADDKESSVTLSLRSGGMV